LAIVHHPPVLLLVLQSSWWPQQLFVPFCFNHTTWNLDLPECAGISIWSASTRIFSQLIPRTQASTYFYVECLFSVIHHNLLSFQTIQSIFLVAEMTKLNKA
jgi:hypothetical protein